MDLSSLEVFCEVAREQSVTRAAKRLSRAPSSVTARVQKLEEHLEVQLISRSGKRMTLTPGGRKLLGYALRLLALADEARAAVSPSLPTKNIRIGSTEAMAAVHLPALLSSYHSRWAHVELQISGGTSQSLIEAVIGSRIDCAFVAQEDRSTRPSPATRFADLGLSATIKYTEEMMLVLPQNHASVRRPHELQLKTFAAFSPASAYRSALEHWLAGCDAGSAANWNVIELASYSSILACVAAGSCFALCPKSLLNLQGAKSTSRTQPITTIDTYLITRTGYRNSAYNVLREYLPVCKTVCRMFTSGLVGLELAKPRITFEQDKK